ncbi:hypothetical protein Tco_0280858 [Tanacetum coccineum]
MIKTWKLLRAHSNWKEIEMPKFHKRIESASKKSKTSETTSHDISESAHVGLNLNEEASDFEEEEVMKLSKREKVKVTLTLCSRIVIWRENKVKWRWNGRIVSGEGRKIVFVL